jgi:hypothetical protein
MRKILLAVILAAGSLLLAVPAAQAAAPQPASFTGSHGRLLGTVVHPTHRDWFADIAVDTHFGFTGSPDVDADAVSAVGRISKGKGTFRVQVDRLRLGAENGSFIQDDYRISADRFHRNNGLLPALPLNSGTNSQALGYGDWRASPCSSPRVASRVYVSVRWADGSLTRTSLRSNYVDPDPNGCPSPPPPPPPDCKTTQATLNDRPDSGIDGNDWALDDLTRTTTFCQTSPGHYHETIADTGTFAASAGQLTPGDLGGPTATICQDTKGSVNGGASADFTAAANWVTYNPAGMIGTFTYPAPGVSTSVWPTGFFSDAAGSLINDDWKWTYTTATETWVNAATGNSGDITGAPCPPPPTTTTTIG